MDQPSFPILQISIGKVFIFSSLEVYAAALEKRKKRDLSSTLAQLSNLSPTRIPDTACLRIR